LRSFDALTTALDGREITLSWEQHANALEEVPTAPNAALDREDQLDLLGADAIEAAVFRRLNEGVLGPTLTVEPGDLRTGLVKLYTCTINTQLCPTQRIESGPIGVIPFPGDLGKARIVMAPASSDTDISPVDLADPLRVAACVNGIYRLYRVAGGVYQVLAGDASLQIQGALWILRARILHARDAEPVALTDALRRYVNDLEPLGG
jgi:hypothetical protein